MKYLIATVAALMLLGCGSQQKEDKQSAQQPAPKEKAAPAATVAEAEADVKTEAKETVEAVEKTAKTAAENVAETAEKVKEDAAEAVEETTTALEKTAAAEPSVDGAALFAQKCASCHGAHAEKAALGKSQVIAGWDAAKIEKALRGYVDGTYGGAMKTIMQGQAKALSDAQIKAVAEYVGTL